MTAASDSHRLMSNTPAIKGFNIDGQFYKFEDDNIAPAWEPYNNYSWRDMVLYKGNLYMCISSHQGSDLFDTSKWEQLSISEYIREIILDYGNIGATFDSISDKMQLFYDVLEDRLDPVVSFDFSNLSNDSFSENHLVGGQITFNFERDEQGRINRITNSRGADISVIWEYPDAEVQNPE